MKIARLLGLLFLYCVFGKTLHAQELISNRSVTGVCYAGTKVNRIYIPPPRPFKEERDAKGENNINVSYYGFPPDARAAVEYAVNIIGSVLPSDAMINIKASWYAISTRGVLGNSTVTGYIAGWAIDAFNPSAYYPLTVAEKIAGKSLNDDLEADIELVINSGAKWYLGTDGNTPVSRYDLVTVVLHELCHGLGFTSTMNTINQTGYYGLGRAPSVYDTFISDFQGNRLIDTSFYPIGSRQLYNALTGGRLYFDGPLTSEYLNGGRARLYAPSKWDKGSSISHLDESGTIMTDKLMTPFIDLGEAIHDPGKLTLSILGDLGWINTRIIHRELKDTEDHLDEVSVRVNIASDTLYDPNSVIIYYSFDGFSTSDYMNLTPGPGDDFFRADIGIPAYNTRMDYYFSVTDVFSRVYRYPSRAEKSPLTFFVGIDTVKPVISHTPPEYIFDRLDEIQLTALITDNIGIDTAFIEYRLNHDSPGLIGMKPGPSDEYEAVLELNPATYSGNDVLRYRIIAIDRSSGANVRTYPSSGYNEVRIESLLPVVTSYISDFSRGEAEFINSGFEISMPQGFSNYGLHSEHPYKSPEEDFKSLDFSSVLRHPIIFDPSGMIISLREVVLVEPGEDDSVYGLPGFYDYVVLEATKDYGKTWFPLADGYDSRYIPSWEDAYFSDIDGLNSLSQGDETMMVKHDFYPRLPDKINVGDTLIFRFRLYSDPYANGWGWAIEDLKITPLVDNIREVIKDNLRIYPNPGNGIVTVIPGEGSLPGVVSVRVYNFNGTCVLNRQIHPWDQATIDFSGNPPGIYFILVNLNGKISTRKYNLVK